MPCNIVLVLFVYRLPFKVSKDCWSCATENINVLGGIETQLFPSRELELQYTTFFKDVLRRPNSSTAASVEWHGKGIGIW